MSAHHREQLLALAKTQAPDHLDELTAYLDDPVLFAATARALVADGALEIPVDLERMLDDDLASDVADALPGGAASGTA